MISQSKYKIGTSTTLSTNGERSQTIGAKPCNIGILSLGCPRNLVDSESILARLNLKGYPLVDIEKSDVAIINTCSFIEDARVESIDAILDLIDLKKRGKVKKIIVYGCLAQRYKDKLIKELPQVDAFIGRISFPARPSTTQAGSRLLSKIDWRENHSLERFPLTPAHYAYLKICEGCINNCSYCIIPQIKGRFTSLDFDSILKRVEEFDQNRISELNIIGQDITGYAMDLSGVSKLPELLERIVKKTKHIGWIRLLYLYPSRLTEGLIGLMGDHLKICKYVDLPIQHINERILKLMHRRTTKKDILKLIAKIRKRIPQVAIRTSLIVGFPSETDEEFQELLQFLEDIRFERLGAFIYSREEGTEAFDFEKQLPRKIKIERFNLLMSRQQKISQEVNQKFLGKTIDVLIDEKDSCVESDSGVYPRTKNFGAGMYLGRSQSDAPEVDGLVYVNSKTALKPGDFVKVKVTDTLEYDLVSEHISYGASY